MKTSEIASRFEASEEARPLLESNAGESPGDTAQKLAGGGHFLDAIRLIAYSLPKRQGVWWACQFVRRMYGDQLKGKASDAVAATERWIAEPTEGNRSAARAAGEAADLSSPAGMTGLAAFFAEGMGPDPKAEVMTPACVSAAVLGACMLDRDIEKIRAAFAQATSFGVEIVQKTNRQR